VLLNGRLAEEGQAGEVTGTSTHPYPQAPLAAVPLPGPGRQASRRGAGSPPALGTSGRDAAGCGECRSDELDGGARKSR
jgi:hypothetical protein